MLDQVEEGRLRPGNGCRRTRRPRARSGRGRALEQFPQRPRNLLGRGDARLVAEQPFDRPQRRRIEVELPCGRQLLQHLDHRPVGDPFSVGQAAPAHDARAVDRADELRGQARLADAGRPEDREQLAGAVRYGLAERLLEAAQLAFAADERRVEAAGEGRRLCLQADQAVGDQGLALALQLQHELLRLDRVPDERRGLWAEQHFARARCLLQAGGHVDRVPGGEPLGGADDDLSRVDADPRLDPELGECVPHLDRRPDRSKCVVLVRAAARRRLRRRRRR